MAKGSPFHGADPTVMIHLEHSIYSHDLMATGDYGIEMTDSIAKSAILKASAILQGKTPGLPDGKPRERCIRDLTQVLVDLGERLQEKGGRQTADITLALSAIENSLKTRHKYHGGTRGYLDYLLEFIPQAGAMPPL